MPQHIPSNFDEALYYFESMEQELALPEWVVDDVYIWKLLRVPVFSEYCRFHGLADEAHPANRPIQRSRLERVAELSRLLLKRNPFMASRAVIRRVVIPTARKQNMDGRMIDSVSYPAWAGCNEKQSLVLDRTSSAHPYVLSGVPSYDALIRLAWFPRQFMRTELSALDCKCIDAMVAALGLNGSEWRPKLSARVVWKTKTFKALERIFILLLQKVRPSHLYVVCSYGQEAPISAAHKLGIHVVEFQHGALGRGHFGYDFRGWGKVPYFPDRMLAFGPDWFDGLYFPRSCNVQSIGSSQIELAAASAMETTERGERQLLVLSQGPYAQELLSHVAEFHKLRPDWSIMVRPHPSEEASHLQQLLARKIGASNGTIVVDNKASLASQAAAASAVVGVNSTALVEALLSGCRVVLMDLGSNMQYFDKLLADGHAVSVRNGQELADCIDDLPDGSARGYFTKPVRDVVAFVEGNAPMFKAKAG